MTDQEILAALKADEKDPEFVKKTTDWMKEYDKAYKAAWADDGPQYFHPGMAPPPPVDVRKWLCEKEEEKPCHPSEDMA